MKAITEEMKVHDEWYEWEGTLEELPEFLRHLKEDYGHDYRTICHAIAASMKATMQALDGGITGFQTGAIMWEVIVHAFHNKPPLKLVDFKNMLYPQYDYAFQKTITPHIWEYLQKQAQSNLENKGVPPHPQVYQHWQDIVNGIVPFGYTIEKTN